MNKFYKVNGYIDRIDNEILENKLFEKLNNELSNYMIFYDAYSGELNNKEVIEFIVTIQANNESGCHYLYKEFKNIIKKLFGKKFNQIILVKGDKI